MRNLDHPLLLYICISFTSFGCAILLFHVGGSLAEVTGNETSIIGFSFKAGGAIAGFILIFILSKKAVMEFYGRKGSGVANIKVYLQAKPSAFERNLQYSAECIRYDEDTGDQSRSTVEPFWEAGYLTVLVKEVGENDFLSIRIKNSDNTVWASESFHSRSPKVAELILLN